MKDYLNSRISEILVSVWNFDQMTILFILIVLWNNCLKFVNLSIYTWHFFFKFCFIQFSFLFSYLQSKLERIQYFTESGKYLFKKKYLHYFNMLRISFTLYMSNLLWELSLSLMMMIIICSNMCVRTYMHAHFNSYLKNTFSNPFHSISCQKQILINNMYVSFKNEVFTLK